MKQNKYLIIGVSILLISAILLFVFRKKIFKKSSAEVETDNIYSSNESTSMSETVSATAAAPLVINAKKVGDRAYSNAVQEIERVKVENGKYVNKGKATASKNMYIGTVEKLTPHGYYIKAAPGLQFPYYYVGTSQVK